ncbi:P-loop containing nucleoside triphosphate hydrolase protein [Lentinus tigrinus ALCF2SS1-7]|uniref:P-loop containing nucleoside triphosphate hydrolase protein n=1 Tax=Lentinus tigrinus ALCF2SS1-6 TaxID=1328759 RepID=A0A5C2S3L9_9APHY|nr:P-loop containing nucleoside triphosphate hydrolase protein [Lentinus tigrinus ALCF2SS1-6]RPD72233.1 P-loop containing nucleoside triphosphate hydrolase protein [Lentinus tigrinus ALCF2SS1-7]
MASTLNQDILPVHLSIVPSRISIRNLTPHTSGAITKHVLDSDTEVLGVSLRLSSNGAVDAVAFATPDVVFYISSSGHQNISSKARTELKPVFDNPGCALAGFGMARIALHLYRHFGIHVQGVDLSTLFARSTRAPQTPAEFASDRIHPDVHRHRIHALWYHHGDKDVCLRAWLSAVLAQDSSSEIDYAAKVYTQNLKDAELRCLAELIMNVELLEVAKPTHMENEFERVEVDADGQLVIRNARFSNRVRASKQTSVVLETAHGHTVTGHAVRAEGKETGIKIAGGNLRGGIERIRVIGREELTHSELARDEFILLLLRGHIASLTESPFIRLLWFPPTIKSVPQRSPVGWASATELRIPGTAYSMLNASQKEVVHAMWSGHEQLVVAHGPPGTGKTTTIAAALERWDRDGESTWVIAQSNVGVKNIARTLVKYAIDFKLVVSKEFYHEWHEHLYESIEERLIRSDDLFSDRVETERRLGGSKTILSTISMLSNPALDNSGVLYIAPVERLIVDEASQIDSFELMHLFHKFKHLETVCMFGDPKQLPPYGQETAPQMKTVFDIKHLKPSAYFLNTQYRMPVPLGKFISEEVYNSKLKSEHRIVDYSCVSFVDVRKGQEQSVGSSWRVSTPLRFWKFTVLQC